MISYYFDLLDSLSQGKAAKIHFATSTVGLLFHVAALFTTPILFLIGMIIDLSTAYTVISGVNSNRYLHLPYPDFFYIIHTIPGKLSYFFLVCYLVSYPIGPFSVLLILFFGLYPIAYVSGAYAFIKLK